MGNKVLLELYKKRKDLINSIDVLTKRKNDLEFEKKINDVIINNEYLNRAKVLADFAYLLSLLILGSINTIKDPSLFAGLSYLLATMSEKFYNERAFDARYAHLPNANVIKYLKNEKISGDVEEKNVIIGKNINEIKTKLNNLSFEMSENNNEVITALLLEYINKETNFSDSDFTNPNVVVKNDDIAKTIKN